MLLVSRKRAWHDGWQKVPLELSMKKRWRAMMVPLPSHADIPIPILKSHPKYTKEARVECGTNQGISNRIVSCLTVQGKITRKRSPHLLPHLKLFTSLPWHFPVTEDFYGLFPRLARQCVACVTSMCSNADTFDLSYLSPQRSKLTVHHSLKYNFASRSDI